MILQKIHDNIKEMKTRDKNIFEKKSSKWFYIQFYKFYSLMSFVHILNLELYKL